jgi:hypothetical protein
LGEKIQDMKYPEALETRLDTACRDEQRHRRLDHRRDRARAEGRVEAHAEDLSLYLNLPLREVMRRSKIRLLQYPSPEEIPGA